MNIEKTLLKITILLTIMLHLNSCGIYRPVSARDFPPEPEKRVQKNIQEGRGFTMMGNNKKGSGIKSSIGFQTVMDDFVCKAK